MDPVCHTLFGATLAAAQPEKRPWAATATLIVTANLPDLDVVAHFAGMDASLYWRRGWSHGLLALVLLPLLWTTFLGLLARLRGVDFDRSATLKLASLGVLSHPTLDWMNTYGMRWLMPFDGRWYYGDTLFIIDPWIWLLLATGTLFGFRWRRKGELGWVLATVLTSLAILGAGVVPDLGRWFWTLGIVVVLVGYLARPAWQPSRARQTARWALVALFVYVSTAWTGNALARQRVADHPSVLADAEIYVGPLPASPTRRDVLVIEPDGYRTASIDLLHTLGTGPPGIEFAPLARGPIEDPQVQRALESPCLRGFENWLRYPWVRLEALPTGGSLIHLRDARYAREIHGGFGGASVRLTPDGAVDGCL